MKKLEMQLIQYLHNFKILTKALKTCKINKKLINKKFKYKILYIKRNDLLFNNYIIKFKILLK